MLLIFTFLCVTYQAKDLTLRKTWDFQIKLVRRKGIGAKWSDKAAKKDFTVNKLEENKDQAITFGANGDKCK